MTQVGHLIRWDIRRFRGLLWFWLLMVAATATVNATWPQLASDPRTRQLVGMTAGLLALTQILLSAVLVAQVVQAHALVGTTSFWMTRPISRGSLLSAKLGLLGTTMIGATVVSEIVVMAIYQVPIPDIIGVSAHTTLRWALWIGVLVTAAALTPSLATYALLIGSALVAGMVMISVLIAVAMYRLEEGPPRGQLYMGRGPFMFWDAPDPTPGMIATAFAIVALIGLLFVQYRTRRRELAVAAGVAGALLTWCASSFWPWPFLAPVIPTPAWSANPATLSLTANANTVAVEPIGFRDQPRDWRQARAEIRLRGIEPGWTASVGVRSATVDMPGGTQLISNYTGFPSSVPVEAYGNRPQQREVVRALLGVESLFDQTPHERGENTIVLFARRHELGRVAPGEGTYQGRFYVGLTHHTVEAVLPPVRGAHHQNGPYRFSISEVQLSSGRLSILSGQSDAVSVFTRRPADIRSFYLRNRRASQAISLPSYDLRIEAGPMRFVPFAFGFEQGEQSGFNARAEMLFFAARSDQPDSSFRLNQQWIDDSELVIVRSTPGGSVERRLAIADFPVRSE